MRILVCAATRAEHDACKRGIERAHDRPCGEHELLLTGVGATRAARALAERLSRGELPDLVVSSGFAGALTPALALSQWITAVRLGEWSAGGRVAVEDGVQLEPFPSLAPCELLSSSTLATASIHGVERPIAVDMESVALAREARAHDVRFTVVRLVSDTPEQPLPAFLGPFTDALAATKATSRLALAARGLRAAALEPRSVARLLADGPAWLRRLEDGWRTFACVRT